MPHWIVARAPGFLAVLDQVRRLADFDVTVLVEGETGVGKELVVRVLHYLSARADSPFVPVNVGAIPDSLFEDELFGHAAGAFTGAHGASDGLVALAEGGTLFLDEIDTLSPHGQVALLRFLQDGSYRPVGGRSQRSANVRVVTATNASPEVLVERGALRRDLYFRLSGLHVTVPPLRERIEEILPLAEHFLAEFNAARTTTAPRRIGPALQNWLLGQPWPGNVRQLRSAIERCFIFADQDEMQPPEPPASPPAAINAVSGFRLAKACAIADFEAHFLADLLREHSGNVARAARAAGKERKSLDRLLRKHGIAASSFRPAALRPTA